MYGTFTMEEMQATMANSRRNARRTAQRAKRRAECDAVIRETARRSAANAISDLAYERRGSAFEVAELLEGEHPQEYPQAISDLLARCHTEGAIVMTGDSCFVADVDGVCDAVFRGLPR